MSNHDEIFRQIARQYADEQGAALRQEAKDIGTPHTPRLDSKLHAALNRRKSTRRRWIAAAAIAACLMLIFVLLPPPDSGTVPNGNIASEGTLPSYTTAPLTMSALPLTFQLPGQFAVDSVLVDRGQTVYTLSDSMSDPVVLTMEQDAGPMDTAYLTALELEGRTIYAKSGADYSFIAFDLDGIRYVMTCRFDVNTLLNLSRAILL